ncbi:MAG: hypothetical protein LBD12_00920 [Clostridiales Family XIII bacterium]|jgi:hypothetical protein|nr:hypothetical protein [Clostridiales Family XIII bacterium]
MTTGELAKRLEAKYGLGGMTMGQVEEEFRVAHGSVPRDALEVVGPPDRLRKRYCTASVARWWNTGRAIGTQA